MRRRAATESPPVWASRPGANGPPARSPPTPTATHPNAVLAVTLLAALGWVAVGVGGDRAEGPLAPGREASTGGLSVAARLLIYLSVTTVLGWAVVLLVFP